MSDQKQCPACGETIMAQATICRFCKTNLTAPAAGAPPPKKSHTTLIVVIVVVVLGVFCLIPVLAALLLPAIARATRNAKSTQCANNLAQLWKMQNNYMVQFGGSQKVMPSERGEKFWLKLSDVGLVDGGLADIYQCPMESGSGKGTCDYRGPSNNVNRYADGDPVGADKESNHGYSEGGNVIRKSGEVRACKPGDPLWSKAATTTIP